MQMKPVSKHLISLAAAVCILAFCGCARSTKLGGTFLPVTIGVQMQNDEFLVSFGGYEPQSQGDGNAAQYAMLEATNANAMQAFEQYDLFSGMVSSLVLSPALADDGLYAVYAPFIYNDDSSEGMYLCLSDDPARLLAEKPQQYEDINAFLDESAIYCPSILSYDIAMRTPGQSCILPVINTNADGQLEIKQGAVFYADKLQGYVDASFLPYIQLLSGRAEEMTIDFNIEDHDRGTVRVRLESSVSLTRYDDTCFYHVDITGSGLVSSRIHTHENVFCRTDSADISRAVNNVIQRRCMQIIRIAQEDLQVDLFGFSSLALAMQRGAIEENIMQLFCDSSQIQVDCSIQIRNLTQIH